MPRNAQSFISEGIENPIKPGAIKFATVADKVVGFTHACPCGCGIRSFIRFRGFWSEGPMWDRSGDDLHMTLTPSIGIHPQDAQGRYHWHGYLRDGVFEEC